MAHDSRSEQGLFRLKYLAANARLALGLVARGDWRRLASASYARLYLAAYRILFLAVRPFRRRGAGDAGAAPLSVQTEHPVAWTSPDHLVPHGTKYNNSTNRKFVLWMHDHLGRRFPGVRLAFMDLGCSGGQLVADFRSLGWTAVGLEGSDYSLKHRRANWRTLAGSHLFTCDITKPYRVLQGGAPARFHLITAWEVLEHIQQADLDQTFRNLVEHLVEGGLFVASTSSATSIVSGIELHQTRMTNAEWRQYLARQFPELEPVELGLKTYHYVRFDFGEPSHLIYRRRCGVGTQPGLDRQ